MKVEDEDGKEVDVSSSVDTLPPSGMTDATEYNVSYDTDRKKLYHNHIVYNDTALAINSLSTRQAYWFTIESFNENGIPVSGKTIKVD